MKNKVAIIMGSRSDMPIMKEAVMVLDSFGVECEVTAISAHRATECMVKYAKKIKDDGFKVVIAGAGGAAHLPGVFAAITTLPVIGVPIETKALGGLDSLLSIVQMPFGIPVATTAIGKAGSKNAALLAVSIMSCYDGELLLKLEDFRAKQTKSIEDNIFISREELGV